MKERLFLILAIILIMPSVFAAMTLDPLVKTEYNIGDEVLFSGSVEAEKEFDGYFEISFVCGSTSTTLPRVQLYMTEGQKKMFPSDIIIPKITTSSTMVGSCSIKVSLIESGIVKESKTTSNFIVSKDLKGSNFNLDKTRLQVGTEFTLSGIISKLDNQNVDGSAEVYLEIKNGSSGELFLGTTSINAGRIDFKYKTTAIPAGNYGIKIVARDLFANQQTFDDVSQFELTDQLNLNVKIDFPDTLPGKTINVVGDIKNIFLESIKEGNIEVKFNDNSYKSRFQDGIINIPITIPGVIKTGKHTAYVKVDDGTGNKAIRELTITVNPIPTALVGVMNSKEQEPGSLVEVTPVLYDQANDVMPGDVIIEIYDPDHNLLYKETRYVNTKSSYTLNTLAPPGSYTLKLSHGSLITEDIFQVSSVTNLDIKLENQTLVVTNIGNIAFRNILYLDFNSGQVKVDQKIGLEPGESTLIILSDLVETGTYNIIAKYDNTEKRFSGVFIEGKKKLKLNVFYIIFLILIILIVIYLLVLKNRKPFRIKLSKFLDKESKSDKSREDKPMIRREAEAKSNFRRFGKADDKDIEYFKNKANRKFGKADNKDVEYFKNKVVEDIKQVQKFGENKRGSYFVKDSNSRNGEKKQLFNMFD
ncbi:MAG: hypothetical protein PHG05_03520 [Candidatus Nanoarchaeia archaeon]|nr:hypothetical protein [Candidatus Nanoarchaeia archaeon]